MSGSLDPERLVPLHHRLADGTPTFGDNPPVSLEALRRIQAGDPCNSGRIAMPLHAGTHVDLPRHFCDLQPSLDDLGPGAWWFSPVVLVDLPAGEGDLLDREALRPHAERIREAEFLAVRTGFSARRSEEAYRLRGPAFSREAAPWLLETAPRLRALGVDAISVASPQRPGHGADFHRAMLGTRGGERYVLLVEDMDLAPWEGNLAGIWVVPLPVAGADGVPCSVFGVSR